MLHAPPRVPTADQEEEAAIGVATFEVFRVQGTLRDLALPDSTPLSVIAVELLPGGGYIQHYGESDPLGLDLGSSGAQRILRCSPLTPVESAC